MAAQFVPNQQRPFIKHIGMSDKDRDMILPQFRRDDLKFFYDQCGSFIPFVEPSGEYEEDDDEDGEDLPVPRDLINAFLSHVCAMIDVDPTEAIAQNFAYYLPMTEWIRERYHTRVLELYEQRMEAHYQQICDAVFVYFTQNRDEDRSSQPVLPTISGLISVGERLTEDGLVNGLNHYMSRFRSSPMFDIFQTNRQARRNLSPTDRLRDAVDQHLQRYLRDIIDHTVWWDYSIEWLIDPAFDVDANIMRLVDSYLKLESFYDRYLQLAGDL